MINLTQNQSQKNHVQSQTCNKLSWISSCLYHSPGVRNTTLNLESWYIKCIYIDSFILLFHFFKLRLHFPCTKEISMSSLLKCILFSSILWNFSAFNTSRKTTKSLLFTKCLLSFVLGIHYFPPMELVEIFPGTARCIWAAGTYS